MAQYQDLSHRFSIKIQDKMALVTKRVEWINHRIKTKIIQQI